jgi:hypothetical protein
MATRESERFQTARAFSGEVATGSPQKMRLLKEKQSEFRFRSNGIRFRLVVFPQDRRSTLITSLAR